LGFTDTKGHYFMLKFIQLLHVAKYQIFYYDPGPGNLSAPCFFKGSFELMLNPLDLLMPSVILSAYV